MAQTTCKKLNLLHINRQYLFGLFFSIKVKEGSCRPKYTSSLLIWPNLNDSETFRSSSSCKNGYLQCVCYRCNLLRWMFFIPCDSWKMLFFSELSSLWDFFNRKLSFSLKQVFWKKSVFCAVSTRTVSTNTTTLVLILMLILSSKKNYPILYLYILEKLSYEAGFFYDNAFYALYLLNCSTLFFIKLFLFFCKLKTYLKACFYIIL